LREELLKELLNIKGYTSYAFVLQASIFNMTGFKISAKNKLASRKI